MRQRNRCPELAPITPHSSPVLDHMHAVNDTVTPVNTMQRAAGVCRLHGHVVLPESLARRLLGRPVPVGGPRREGRYTGELGHAFFWSW